MHLNYPKLVHKHPAHLASLVKMYLGKVRYSRTTPNSCERTLHTLLSLFALTDPPHTLDTDLVVENASNFTPYYLKACNPNALDMI